MKRNFPILLGMLALFALGYFTKGAVSTQSDAASGSEASLFNLSNSPTPEDMKLGAFSISIEVKDLATSKAFYEKLGFSAMGGSMEQNYLIMKNGNALIGIFQGMFKGHILTFNPGWDENAQNLEEFDDVREIQKRLKGHDLELTLEADETKTGPGSIMLTDPDGNQILIDQHR